MTEEKVNFKNSKNQNLAGILHIPSVEKPAAVVMIHGLGGDKNEWGLFVNIAKKLCKNGYMVLRFDCAGSGESDGIFRNVTRQTEADDLSFAINFIKKQNIDKEKIAIIGLSLGASVSLIAYTSKIKTMVLLSAAIVGNVLEERYGGNEKYLKELNEKGYFKRISIPKSLEIGKELFYETNNLNLKEIAEKIDAPILLIHGSKDDVVPIENAKILVNFFKNVELKIIEGSGHNYRKSKYEAMVISYTLDWFNKWLL